MIEIPLPFVVALLLVVLLIRLYSRDEYESVGVPATVFIGACTIMSIIVGVRWTFDIPFLRVLQPTIAATLPPIAWLCFSGLAGNRRSAAFSWRWLHTIPITAIGLASAGGSTLQQAVDPMLTASFLGYGLSLLRLGLSGPDALGATRLADTPSAHKAILAASSVLLVSGLIDLAIAIDFDFNQGTHAAAIVGVASLAILPLIAFAAGVAGRSLPSSSKEEAGVQSNLDMEESQVEADDDGSDAVDDIRIIDAIDDLMKQRQLFRDPDLTLNRLASRAGIPARQVSAAINRVRQCNVSQVVNAYRIDEAKRLLSDTDLPVTQIMLRCGFQTKSNFNREFRRITGMSPSDYRSSGSPTDARSQLQIG